METKKTTKRGTLSHPYFAFRKIVFSMLKGWVGGRVGEWMWEGEREGSEGALWKQNNNKAWDIIAPIPCFPENRVEFAIRRQLKKKSLQSSRIKPGFL